MAYACVGNTVTDTKSGDTTVLDKGSTHGDAVKSAQDRAGGPKGSAGQKPTAGRVIFYSFDDARDYETKVDVKAAMADDVAKISDQKMIEKLLARTDAEVRAAHAVRVRAKQVDEHFEDPPRGVKFPAGSWVVMSDGKSSSYTDVDFKAKFKAVPKPATTPKD